MNPFGNRHRRRADRSIAVAPVPAGGASVAAPARFSDPVAQAMHPRAADAVWFGGISFRAEQGEVR
jgi:hypothetical protein